ncbi:MAG TPA: hypothetical protein PLR06_08310, partial [Cyclobacteriaceae bacterium]|nr:hypothetical protein [Cyclobacteriaceae bacterium]
MKRLGCTFCLFFVLTGSFAQTLLKSFFDKEDFQTDSAKSYYFEMRVLDDNSNPPLISYYTATNKIRFKEAFKDEQGDKLRTYYYPNGVIKAEGVFSNLGPKGLVNAFYDDGRRQSELFFEMKTEVDSHEPVVGIINYWDSVGNHIVDNGKGFCHCNLSPFSDQILFENGRVEDGLKIGEWEGQGMAEGLLFTFKEAYNKG